MRHLLSLIVVPIIGAAIFLLGGIANAKFSLAHYNPDSTASKYTAITIALVAFFGAGLLYGLLLLVRFSPLGLVLTGLVFMGMGTWAVTALNNYVHTMPTKLIGIDGAGYGTGTISLLLGVPLAMTVFSPRRWRRWANPVAAVPASPGYAPPTYPASTYPASTDSSYPYSPESPVSPSYGTPSYSAPPNNSPYSGAPVSPASPYGNDPGGYPPPGYSSGETDSTRRL